MDKQKLREEIYKNSEKFTGHVEGTESQSKQEADRHKEWLKKSDQLFNLITEYTAQAVAEAREEAVKLIKARKLQVPNKYGEYVQIRIHNRLLDEVIYSLEKEARDG